MPLVPPQFFSGWKLVGIFGMAAAGALAEEAPTPRVVLPKMQVTAPAIQRPHDPWRYARFSNFEILSKDFDFSGRSLLTSLQKFDHALRVIYPAIAEHPGQPLGILLTHDAQYQDFAPADAQEFSLFFRASERSLIVVNVDADTALPDDEATGRSTVDPYRQLYRQYLRYLFAEKNTKLPAWLEEGLAQTISDIELRGKWLTYGKVETEQNMQSGDQPAPFGIADFLAPNSQLSGLTFNQVFAHRSVLPLGEFFAAQLANGSAPSSDSAWAKQAYAFVHFCMFGNQLRYRAPLITFAERLRTEPLSEELFRGCFGVNYARMNDELRGYIISTRHKYQRYPLKPEDQAEPVPVEFREATEAEVAQLKGEFLRVCGREDAAREIYQVAYIQGIRTPELLAGFAASSVRIGEKARAHELVDAAVQGGVSRPSAYVLQARLRFENLAGPPAPLSDGQLAAVLSPLFAARKLSPPLPETYELIAEAWSRSSTVPKPENLAVLDEGIRRFPRDRKLLTLSHELYRRIGDRDKAASIARLGIRFAPDADARAHFEKLAQVPPDQS